MYKILKRGYYYGNTHNLERASVGYGYLVKNIRQIRST